MIVHGPYMIIYGPYMIIYGPCVVTYGPCMIISGPTFDQIQGGGSRRRSPPAQAPQCLTSYIWG